MTVLFSTEWINVQRLFVKEWSLKPIEQFDVIVWFGCCIVSSEMNLSFIDTSANLCHSTANLYNFMTAMKIILMFIGPCQWIISWFCVINQISLDLTKIHWRATQFYCNECDDTTSTSSKQFQCKIERITKAKAKSQIHECRQYTGITIK